MRFAIERAANICFPGLDLAQKVSELPGYGTLWRYELVLDVSFMMMRSRIKVPHVRWLWTDSSPQKGFDWIWSEFHEVPVGRVAAVFQAVLDIQSLVLTFPGADLDDAFNVPLPDDWDRFSETHHKS